MDLDRTADSVCRAATTIALKMGEFKVCDDCGAIQHDDTKVCSCGHYRFEPCTDEILLDTIKPFPELYKAIEIIIAERDKLA